MLSGYRLEILSTFCRRSPRVRAAPAPTRDAAGSPRGVNILGGVALGLGCCVHALVLFLLLVRPVVTTARTCLRPPGALPRGGRPSATGGSGQIHSRFTDETTKVPGDQAACLAKLTLTLSIRADAVGAPDGPSSVCDEGSAFTPEKRGDERSCPWAEPGMPESWKVPGTGAWHGATF